MEFLKELLGEELYTQIESKINEHKGSESHNHNHKAYKVAETVWNHICKVEAVPDVVELSDNTAYEHKEHETEVNKLFFE